MKSLNIFICMLVLLIAIGAVSAMEFNSTDEVMSVEQNDEIAVSDNSNEVLSANNNDEVISVSDINDEILSVDSEDNGDVLSVEDSDEVISVIEGNSVISSAENSDAVISVSNDNNSLTYSPFAKVPEFTQSQTQYKTFYLGKVKFLKKFKKMALNGYKIPSKKNKKAWKKHKAYKKAYKKQYKKFKKAAKKVIKKADANHWHASGKVYYKLKYSGKYIHILFYIDCYRTYNYNPLLNKEWWD